VQSFALQATRKDILVHDPSFTQYRTLPELYPPGSTCFSLMNSFYGAQGVVKEILPKNNGKITVVLTEYEVKFLWFLWRIELTSRAFFGGCRLVSNGHQKS